MVRTFCAAAVVVPAVMAAWPPHCQGGDQDRLAGEYFRTANLGERFDEYDRTRRGASLLQTFSYLAFTAGRYPASIVDLWTDGTDLLRDRCPVGRMKRSVVGSETHGLLQHTLGALGHA